ncbi:MAG: TonB-dependent receptor [Candidatus Pseudobacter hemicellulosilyticus]|uniref:TonB-dependent receptor n=1 Tax=Candidatus Pseudobacter hemicellulosilyticus TaxID=3121375 RepID=A0AAJ6BJ07_9BACT|nr:MAG: TonB-dependent receptor [Pseudobacter sp.]
MRIILQSVAFMAMLGLVAPLYAQTPDRVITGIVTNADQQAPLEGATITAGNQQTISQKDGSFKLTLRNTTSFIVVSFTGYEPQRIRLSAASILNISLQPSSRQLDDVIVTGYSTQNRRFIAGSIASISVNDIKHIPAASFNQLLQGKAAGVQVTANSGVPGGGITFRVRGNNSINAAADPLYIVDGVIISNTDLIKTSLGNQQQSNPLADINPADIQTIQVLKDANATAIYGSLGANGVVIVTTKRGKQNTAGKVSLHIAQGWSDAPKKFKLVSGPENGLLVNESRINTAIDQGIDPATIILPYDPDTLQTYDRISGLFRTARTQNYEVGIQGGGERSNYYASFGYLKQEGIIRPSNFERFSARLNYDNQVNQRLKVGTSINISRTYRNVSVNDNSPTGVINSAIFPRSFLPIYNANGTYARYGSFDNHIALIENLDNNAVGWRSIGNVYAELSILKELKFRTSYSLDYNSMYENNYSNTLISAGIASNGSASSNETKNTLFTADQVLTYIKTFSGRHSVNALVGNSINTILNQNTNATGTGFPSNSIKAISAAANRSGSSSESLAKLVSFFGKASYTLDNKYTIDGSIRADASSRFGVNNRWGYFPSGGFTWRLSQEDLVERLGIFDDLKLRASIGLSGTQNGIDAYAAPGLWATGYNYLEQPGTAPFQLANPDLTWETTRQLDIGTEFTILDRRLTITVDYYNKYTYDLLLNVPVPYRSGFTNYLQNFGAVRNKGWELSINTVNINTADFSWTTDFNISWNRNRIEKLASDITLGASGRNTSILREGHPINSFYLYKQLYVDPQTGNAVYEDVNKDGFITSADRQIVGNANPNYSGGLNNTLAWKNFELNFFLFFTQGNKIMNMQNFFLVHGGTQSNIGFLPIQLERWQKPGDITDIPRLTTYSRNPTQNGGPANNYGGTVASLSSRYLEDASFLRLRNVSFSYQFPSGVTNRLRLNALRAYVQVTNLFTISNYSGLDPEVSSQSANQNTAGYDWATVPQPRTIQVGLNVSF